MHRPGDRKFHRDSSLPEKPVYGLGVIVVSGLDKGLCPLGLMQSVGIKLGFQCDTAPLAVKDTALAPFREIIACLLYTSPSPRDS